MIITYKELLKNIILLLTLIVMAQNSFGQSSFTINGHVSDSKNGEDLIGVTIYSVKELSGTISNHYGFYSLSLPAGTYTIRFSYLGYDSVDSLVNLTSNIVLDIELEQSTINLEEVIVSAERRDINISEANMGVERLNVR